MAACVHHDHTVSGPQEKFGLADDADAIVCHAMKKKDPRAIGIVRSDCPASEVDAVCGAYIEILSVRMRKGEGGLRFANEIGRQFAPNGTEIPRRYKPAGHGGQQWRQEQQDERDADQAFAHGHLASGLPSLRRLLYKVRLERLSSSRSQLWEG